MMKANTDIRNEARRQNVYLYQIADSLGMQETRFCKLLRKELPQAEKEKILAVIEEIAKEGS